MSSIRYKWAFLPIRIKTTVDGYARSVLTGEPATFARLAFVALIIVGLVGLKMVSAE